MITNVSRRSALKGVGAAGLMLAFGLPAGGRRAVAAEREGAAGQLNAFLRIGPDGGVTFYSPYIEMGQGTYTSFPQIVAEELDAEMAMITVEQAPHGSAYRIMFGNTQRFTGGSYSIRSSYDTMRKAGAAARQMLLQAAAERFGVEESELTTEPGRVVHAASGQSAPYGELAEAAAALDAPEDPPLKDPSTFRLIGKPIARTDTVSKANGSATFGIDVEVPGMVHAAVRQSPQFGGGAVSFDAEAVTGMPGVIAVETIGNGVAVIANSFWRAKQAVEALPVEWGPGDAAGFSSPGHMASLKAHLEDEGKTAEDQGDVGQAFSAASATIEAVYEAPFLAHVTMEPMNATADVREDACTVWAPNQGADITAEVAAGITGLPSEKIRIITPYLGGGYGRRFFQDFTAHAVELSKKTGRPVKVIWTREEDIQHDHYRPQTVVRHRAAFDAAGTVTGWETVAVGEGPIGRHFAQAMEDGIDPSVIEGAWKQPYAVANRRVRWVKHTYPAPVGFWRSVGHSFNGFFTEGFVDEMADAAGLDPVEFRRQLLQQSPRHLAILERIVEMAGYRPGTWTEEGRTYAHGVAVHESFGSIVGQVALITIEAGQPRALKYWCAVDCGTIVNPDTIVAQMESGISTGLSQALFEEVSIEDGRVVEGNFDTYRVLPPHLMPEVEVAIIESGAEKGGIGEPGTPPAAPALANAVAKLTGERIRRLPFKNHKLSVRSI